MTRPPLHKRTQSKTMAGFILDHDKRTSPPTSHTYLPPDMRTQRCSAPVCWTERIRRNGELVLPHRTRAPGPPRVGVLLDAVSVPRVCSSMPSLFQATLQPRAPFALTTQ
ncbi:hypothetical protein PMIN01_11623 [Paraphaeosphaeria minitans]|uniref:Uncharacterized protein n=1 Tax=Paraphaeosphaeria minitans TaxID=565426 RepID=A0A9P6G8F1_9PLEO|nr:hypothetical protein PMIN01_11623 [Paraphaeosphaeria minitans]